MSRKRYTCVCCLLVVTNAQRLKDLKDLNLTCKDHGPEKDQVPLSLQRNRTKTRCYRPVGLASLSVSQRPGSPQEVTQGQDVEDGEVGVARVDHILCATTHGPIRVPY